MNKASGISIETEDRTDETQIDRLIASFLIKMKFFLVLYSNRTELSVSTNCPDLLPRSDFHTGSSLRQQNDCTEGTLPCSFHAESIDAENGVIIAAGQALCSTRVS
jgi:hypothetical protein